MFKSGDMVYVFDSSAISSKRIRKGLVVHANKETCLINIEQFGDTLFYTVNVFPDSMLEDLEMLDKEYSKLEDEKNRVLKLLFEVSNKRTRMMEK